MGCGGSKNKTKKPRRQTSGKYKAGTKLKDRKGFEVTKELIDSLTPEQRSEFVINPDIYSEGKSECYFDRDELPPEKYMDVLKAVRNGKFKDFNKYKVSKLDMVVGLNELADVGNKKDVSGSEFNPLHWAVYNGDLKTVKNIMNNWIFNILIVGKVPSNIGLANDSEVSIDEDDIKTLDEDHHDLRKAKSQKMSNAKTISEARYGTIPRSLILFWPIDQENVEMFKYLWNLDGVNWGIKNLKFNLTMICIKENVKLLEALLFSESFDRIINSLTFDEAMDFLESFIVKNQRISDELKTELFERKSMLAYDYMGELMGLVYNKIQDEASDTQVNSANVDHLKDIHDRLGEPDFNRICSSKKALSKINELKQFLDNMEDTEEREEIEELLEEFE